ncbi:hypothetical protein JDW15_01645 [Aerococcaceae bacterium zg-ZJ1578]|uniref:hypothetical protein n=1 Tax=Aerococcaceae bacterium zg-252 TaxID=2796928 RepID=UPI001A1ABBA6|nr:hypothetical protein [Aerococcaceae bacterium zg-1578]
MKKLLIACLLFSGILFPKTIEAFDYYMLPNRTVYYYDENKDRWVGNGPGIPYDNTFLCEVRPQPHDRIILVDYDGNLLDDSEISNTANIQSADETSFEYAVDFESLEHGRFFQAWNTQQIRIIRLSDNLWSMTTQGKANAIRIETEPLLNITVYNGENNRQVKVNTVFRQQDTNEILAYAFYNRDGGISLALPQGDEATYTEYDSLKYNSEDALTMNPLDYPEFTKYTYSDAEDNSMILTFYGTTLVITGSAYYPSVGIFIGDEYRLLDSGDYGIDYVKLGRSGNFGDIFSAKIHYDKANKQIQMKFDLSSFPELEGLVYSNFDTQIEAFNQDYFKDNLSKEERYLQTLKSWGNPDYKEEMWKIVEHLNDAGATYHLTDKRIDWSQQ